MDSTLSSYQVEICWYTFVTYIFHVVLIFLDDVKQTSIFPTDFTNVSDIKFHKTPSPGSQADTQVLKLSWWQNSMKISRANNRVKIVFQCFGELLLFNLEDVLVVLPHHQHTLKLGTELVPETSENLLILTQLSAGRKFNWSWCIVYRRTERHDDANRRTERHDDANRLN